jgi:hypothetical protein
MDGQEQNTTVVFYAEAGQRVASDNGLMNKTATIAFRSKLCSSRNTSALAGRDFNIYPHSYLTATLKHHVRTIASSFHHAQVQAVQIPKGNGTPPSIFNSPLSSANTPSLPLTHSIRPSRSFKRKCTNLHRRPFSILVVLSRLLAKSRR